VLQEFGHQFAAFARYRDPNTNATMTDLLLGGVLGHWALNLDDEKSPMDYDVNDWVESPNGTFRKVAIPSDQRIYCNLDLYLMGLLGPGEVGEITPLRNVQPVGGSTTDFTATPVRLNIQHFINQEGARIPSVAAAQKTTIAAAVSEASSLNSCGTTSQGRASGVWRRRSESARSYAALLRDPRAAAQRRVMSREPTRSASVRVLVLPPRAGLGGLRFRRSLEQEAVVGRDERVGRHHRVGVVNGPVLAREGDPARALAQPVLELGPDLA